MDRRKITFFCLLGLIIALSTLIRFIYLGYTDYRTRTYDVVEGGGHLDYIRYILKNHVPPDPTAGWEYHQPPLYYYAAATIVGLSHQSVQESVRLLQVVSLLISSGMTVIGTAIFCRLFSRKRDIILATMLLAFWPSGIIHAVRIGNDSLAQLFFSAAMLFLLIWIQTKRKKQLFISLVFAIFTLFTKKTGFILVGVYGCMFLYLFVRHRLRHAHLPLIAASTVILLIFGFLSVERNVASVFQHERASILVGKITINRGLYIGNRLSQFIFFNPARFITQPYTSTWRDDMGRQSFPFFFMKSVLFAEFSFDKPYQPQIASAMSTVFLLMSIVAGAAYLVILLRGRPVEYLMALIFASSIMFLLLFRWQEPYASNQDFRYIYPAIIPLIYGYVYGVRVQKGTVMRALGYLLPNILILLSVAFFLIPAFIK